MISVLLPFRNAASTVAEAAASILADMSDDDELVAIDDRSTDDSRARLPRDPRIVLVEGDGAGVACALAKGHAASRGDLVARMDADDVSLPGRLAASRALLDSDASLGVVATQVEPKGASERFAAWVAWQNALVSRDDHAHAIFVETPICTPAVLMRRDALEACGGWHDPPWAEDWDLWLRMHERGFGIAKVPRVLFRWHRHDAALTVTDARYSEARVVECRAHYLARHLTQRLGERRFAIWGAGRSGRRLARSLEPHGKRPVLFVDIDPKKQRARDADVVRPEALPHDVFVLASVRAPGARDLVRERLRATGRREGDDFLACA